MVRLKNRYITIEISSGPSSTSDTDRLKLNEKLLSDTLYNKLQQLHGDFGVAAVRAGFHIKYLNRYTGVAIIRCRHGPHKLLTSVIPFVTSFESCQVCVNTLYIGATIRHCFEFTKLYQERKCDELCALVGSEEEKQKFKDVLLNFDKIMGLTLQD